MSKVGDRSTITTPRGSRGWTALPDTSGNGRPLSAAAPRALAPAPLVLPGDPGGWAATRPGAGGEARPRGATAAKDSPPTLYARRKAQYSTVFWAGIIGAVVLHWALFRFFPAITIEQRSYAATELRAVELPPPEVEIPPPPERIARPAVPVVSAAEINEDITIAPTNFAEYVPSALPPPPVFETPVDTRGDAPPFTPYTVGPVLRNPDEAARAIAANYPRALKEAGIGGTTLLWFYIDENGKVLETRVARGSGYEQLDRAASDVAEILSFSPAFNRDIVAKVWVQIPIVFTVPAR